MTDKLATSSPTNVESQHHGVVPSTPKKPNGNEHRVVLTLTAAIACSKGSDEQGKLLEELARRNKKTLDAPKPQQFFHCEYGIAPGHERTVADIVTYGVAAKVFTETDSKVIKTWDDGSRTWVAWVHSHELYISEENIMDLFNHTLEFKLCDSKDKVSAKARFDRPKAFRIPSSKDSAPGKGIAAVVAKQSRSWTNLQPQDVQKQAEEDANIIDDKPEVDEPTTNQQLPVARVHSSVGRLAGLDVTDQDKRRMNELVQQQTKLMKQLNRKSSKHGDDVKPTDSGQAKDEKRQSVDITRSRNICIPIKMELLFSGMKEVTSRLEEPSVNVEDMFVSVSVGGKLMPVDLERKLNPLVITVRSVKDLPETPIPRITLSNLCQDVYCSYEFLDLPIHKTRKRHHNKDVYFEDMHVILAGKLDPGKLYEFLHCDGLSIEIHDRDRKLPDVVKPPLIFGDDSADKKIANVGLVTSKSTTHNAFHDRHCIYDPYGVTKLQLHELLDGNLNLNYSIVVNPCSLPNLLNNPNSFDPGTKLVGVIGSVDRPENPPLLCGDYLSAGTVLKAKVCLKYPLTWHPSPDTDLLLNNESCHFGRIIYHFDYENKSLLKTLEKFVMNANARALGLDSFDQHVIDAALSTYKLSAAQKECTTLDVVTGFHVLDGEFHIFVLEGLRDGSILRLQNEIGHVQSENDGFVRMLCDSSITFKSRIYSELDVNLCTIRLHQPLKVILEQPLLYVRDLVPRPCFRCLIMIKEITEVSRLKDVCRNFLFPDHTMVISMSREFGIPITHSDYEEQHLKEDEEKKSLDGVILKESSSRWTPIDNKAEDFDKTIAERKKNPDLQPNYVMSNIVSVQEAGRRKRPAGRPMVYADIDGPPHNYSTQTLNFTELSKTALRRMLYEQDKDSRYAYNELYNTAVIPPVDEDMLYSEEEKMLKQQWRTDSGFLFPGVKSSLLCNQHPLCPDESRIDELKLKWKENTLHGHILKPTLDRAIWKWDLRHQDMKLYNQPRMNYEEKASTVHLPGDKRLEEIEQARIKKEREWKSKIIVDSSRMKFHRVACGTEQTNKSNQIDKLQNILKDEPNKKSLKYFPTRIPPLSVVSGGGVEMKTKDKKQRGAPFPSSRPKSRVAGYQPGPYDELSWKMDKNVIPIRSPEHEKYITQKGSDFSMFLKDEEYLWKRRIDPLSEKEKENLYEQMLPPVAARRQIKPLSPEPIVLEDKRSEYRQRFLAADDPHKRQPIWPRHQLKYGLSHLMGPAFNDASVELTMQQDEIAKLSKSFAEKQTKKHVNKQDSLHDDVQIVVDQTKPALVETA
uniref:uncharacterized protein LOC120328106 n=1 Tax=Styela clava TaxID=7725 RepID=UPI001939526B|nr:uncharacterized protein LOC120328106 [Styela clava]